MELPKRKRNRLDGYDYSLSGAYFVTICVKERAEMLWNSINKNVGETFGLPKEGIPKEDRPKEECPNPLSKESLLSDIGKVVDDEIKRLDTVYENVFLGDYCIMPDHIHIIIFISDTKNGRLQISPTISRIIQQFKGAVTKRLGFSMWQKSFYDHIIRDEHDYEAVRRYIDGNPMKYFLDR